MNKDEKKALIRFLFIYVSSTIFLVSIILYIYYANELKMEKGGSVQNNIIVIEEVEKLFIIGLKKNLPIYKNKKWKKRPKNLILGLFYKIEAIILQLWP